MRALFTKMSWRALVGGWLLVSLPTAGLTAELILVEQGACYSCVRFKKEQGDVFDLWFGKEFPLRRVDIHGRWPYKDAGIRRPMGTPTFIVLEEGKEIGRFAGYGDSPRFWKKLDDVLTKR
jgi:thioredoxin-related protein